MNLEVIGPMVATMGLFIMTFATIKIILDHKIRSRLIDKGLVDEKVKNLYPARSLGDSHSSLKWGLVSLGIGLAVLIGRLASFAREMRDEVTVGGMFLLAGLALIIYYFIARKKEK